MMRVKYRGAVIVKPVVESVVERGSGIGSENGGGRGSSSRLSTDHARLIGDIEPLAGFNLARMKNEAMAIGGAIGGTDGRRTPRALGRVQ